jgi:26S proteasome regulatory subunit N9
MSSYAQSVRYVDSTAAFLSTSDPELSGDFTELSNYYKSKLWHQLTKKLTSIINNPRYQQKLDLIELYENFIQDFEGKINQVELALMIITISKQYKAVDQAITFVKNLIEKVKKSKDAYIILRSVLATKQIEAGNVQDCKKNLEEIKEEIEVAVGLEARVYEYYYHAWATYYKHCVNSEEFYKSSLMYLSYIPIESLSDSQKSSIAFDIGLAALVGNNIYNFGELLSHPILDSLKGGENSWMVSLLNAFNFGKIEEYESLVQQYGAVFENQPILKNNTVILKKKMAIMTLMDLVFQRSSGNRTVSFEEIARVTKLPIEHVELLVMKAFSLKVLKGIIDQVAKVVHFSWVQPRILHLEQVKDLKKKLEGWAQTVTATRNLVEDQTGELFS